MATPTLVELAEAGAHYGHHRSMVYPKAKSSVFMIKNNVALIDLEQTQAKIEEAAKAFAQAKAAGGTILLVGTRRLVRDVVKELGQEFDLPYLNERWYGGFLTNFESFQNQIKVMNELAEFLNGDEAKKLDKKDRLLKERHLTRLNRFLGGVKKLTQLPDLIVLASAGEDKVAISEANRVGVPTIAIADTDINPELVTVAVPANDDAPKAVNLILRSIFADKPTVKDSTKAAEKTKTDDKLAKKTPKAKIKTVKTREKKAAPKKTVAKKTTTALKPKAKVAAKKA